MSDSEGDNPIDTLILKPAEQRVQQRKGAAQQAAKEAAASDGQPSGDKKRRKRSSSSNLAEQAQAKAARQEAGDAVDVKAAGAAASQPNPAKVPPAADAVAKAASQGPVGVVVIKEGDADPRNYEMQKLLRAPRYLAVLAWHDRLCTQAVIAKLQRARP